MCLHLAGAMLMLMLAYLLLSTGVEGGGPAAKGEHLLVYRNPHPQYHADFPSIAVAEDNSVLIILRQCGPWAYEANFEHHIGTFFDADTEMIIIRSTDGARSFHAIANNPVFEGLACDPVMLRLADGRIMAGSIVGEAGPRAQRHQMKGVLHRHFPRIDTVITFEGVAVRLSEDNGLSWGEPRLVVPYPPESLYGLRKPVELADGTLLMPLAVGYPWRSRFVGIIRSWDGGQQWGDESYIAEDPQGRCRWATGTDYWRPALGLGPNAELICVYVEGRKDSSSDFTGQLLCSRSGDAGFTWGQPQPLGLVGSFPSLTRLSDGRYLLTFVSSHSSVGSVEVVFSSDGGATWEPRLALRTASDHLFYYPDSVELPDGDIFTVYMTAPPSKVRIVEAVRWRPEGGHRHR